MWTSVDEYWNMPVNLPNEFLKSEFNSEIMNKKDLYMRVSAFVKQKKYKQSWAKDATKELLRIHQRQIRYSFDSC